MARILIVDDRRENRLLLRRTLSAAGHDTAEAEDGSDCVARVRENPPDLILLDLLMPLMDGDEACRQIKSDPNTATIPILMVSAQDDEQRIVACLDAGAQDYITKPFNPRIVEARVRSALRAKRYEDRQRTLLAQLESSQRELRRANAELSRLSLEDGLLHIGNRRALEMDLEQADGIYQRYERSYAVALIDVDQFKSYNDTHGHPAGDRVLREVADVTQASIRDSDRVYRYGGEELLVFMPETDEGDAARLAERLRSSVEQLACEHEASSHKVVTLSIGAASPQTLKDSARGWRDVIRAADAALYAAKRDGRNCVRIGSEQL